MYVALAPVAVVCIARPLRTGVHIVAGYDVHAHIGRRPADVVALPPRHGHGRLAAAVVEQVHVGAAEVPVRDAVDDVVKARLAQPDPGGRVEDAIGHRRGRTVGEHYAERQPERDKDQEAVEVGARQRQVPRVRQAGLEVGRAHEALHVHDDADVAEEGEHQRQQDQNGHDARLVRLHVIVDGARAVVEVDVDHVLHASRNAADAPHEQQQHGGLASIEERRYVLRRAQAQVVLNGGELRGWVNVID